MGGKGVITASYCRDTRTPRSITLTDGGCSMGTNSSRIVHVRVSVASGGKVPYPCTSGRLDFRMDKPLQLLKMSGKGPASVFPCRRPRYHYFQKGYMMLLRSSRRGKGKALAMRKAGLMRGGVGRQDSVGGVLLLLYLYLFVRRITSQRLSGAFRLLPRPRSVRLASKGKVGC